MRLGGWASLVSLAMACGVAAPVSAQDEKVGVTAAVNPDATGTPPRRATRTLSIGLDMIRNERIVTGPIGKTQLIFVDGSALTIGPNAELMLDEFVYDPEAGTGRLAMTATKGVFRVVGGKISKTEAITLKTPTATLGIRGGIATAEVGPNGFFGFLFGQKMTVDGTGADGQPTQQVVTRPGTGVPLGANGTLGSPMPIPPEKMQAAMQAFEGEVGRSGGAPERPTDVRVAATELAGLGSNLPPEVVGAEPAAGGPGAPGTGLPPVPDSGVFGQDNLTNLAAASPSGAGATTPANVLATFAGRYKSTPGSGSADGTAGDGSSAFDRGFIGGTLLDNGLFVASAGGDSFSAPVNLSGGLRSYADTEANSPFGPIAGTSFLSPNKDFAFFESVETSFIDERSFLFAGVATPLSAIPTSGFAAYDIRRDFVGGTDIPFIPAAMGGNLAGSVSPAYVGFAPQGGVRPLMQVSVAIVGSGLAQSSAISLLVGTLGGSGALNLIGDMRGSSQLGAGAPNFFGGPVGFALDGNGNGTFGASGPDYFVLESRANGTRGIATSDGNLVPGTYYPNNVASRQASFATGSRSAGNLLGFMNGVSLTTTTLDGAFFETLESFSSTPNMSLALDPASNTVSASANVVNPSFINYGLSFGGSGATGGRRAFIDDTRFAALENPGNNSLEIPEGPTVPLQNTQFYFVSGKTADIAALLPTGVTPCECSFLRWGFWGADFSATFFGDTQRQRVHLGQWVAGDLPSAAEIAGIVGMGTYSGHAVADIVNNGRAYKAGGGFSMNYEFGLRSGSVTISNLDGLTYTGGVSASSTLENVPSGSIGATHPNFGGVSGSIGLGFYRNGANPAGGVGGAFNAGSSGQAYTATGIVVGQQTSFTPPQ